MKTTIEDLGTFTNYVSLGQRVFKHRYGGRTFLHPLDPANALLEDRGEEFIGTVVVVDHERGFVLVDDGKTFERRDLNGSLICGQCEQPFPYAEPEASGAFTCYGCRSFR